MKISNILFAIFSVFIMSCSNNAKENDHGHSHDSDQHEHLHEGDDHMHHGQEEFTEGEDSMNTEADSSYHKHGDGSIHHDH